MADIQQVYTKDSDKCLTPVYVPYESYSFGINGMYFSDPNPQLLNLRIVDIDGVTVAKDFATIGKVYPFDNAMEKVYQLYFKFAMPEVDNGQYRFALHSYLDNKIKLTSNIILVENEVTDTTVILEYSHSYDIYGYSYSLPKEQTGQKFTNVFRLPISLIDQQFERDIKNYRRITDQRLRTIRSYRDLNVKVEARAFDDLAHEALSAVLEHDEIILDGVTLQPKTALTIVTNTLSDLDKSTFEAYASTPEEQYGIFNGFGQLRIFGGNAFSQIDYIFQPNGSLISEDGFFFITEDGAYFVLE